MRAVGAVSWNGECCGSLALADAGGLPYCPEENRPEAACEIAVIGTNPHDFIADDVIDALVRFESSISIGSS